MPMHTTGLTKKLDHPQEEGDWIMIRKVSSGYLDVARETFQRRYSRTIKDMGGLGDIGTFKRCRKCTMPKDEGHECDPQDVFAKEERDKGPGAVDAATVDRKVLLNAAIVSWSADMKVNEESIADLEEFTAAWLFREIISYINEGMTAEAKKGTTKPSSSS